MCSNDNWKAFCSRERKTCSSVSLTNQLTKEHERLQKARAYNSNVYIGFHFIKWKFLLKLFIQISHFKTLIITLVPWYSALLWWSKVVHSLDCTLELSGGFTKKSCCPRQQLRPINQKLLVEHGVFKKHSRWFPYMCAESLQLCLTLGKPMACKAHQVPLSVGFSRQGYWSGLPCPPSEDISDHAPSKLWSTNSSSPWPSLTLTITSVRIILSSTLKGQHIYVSRIFASQVSVSLFCNLRYLIGIQ